MLRALRSERHLDRISAPRCLRYILVNKGITSILRSVARKYLLSKYIELGVMSSSTNAKRLKVAEIVDLDSDESENDVAIASNSTLLDVTEEMLAVQRNLAVELGEIKFALPIKYVYSPLEYAFDTHAMYVKKYCTSRKRILFLGLTPGPWGMSQTGIPFGEISMVRNWLQISGAVEKPSVQQPDRPVTGFNCTRTEVNGRRFWGLFEELCKTPEKFFEHAYVHCYCPLALMTKTGCNITPAELKEPNQRSAQQKLYKACNKALADVIELLHVATVIGVGGDAEKRARIVVRASKLQVKVLGLPHPNPKAPDNKNWIEKARKKLNEDGLLKVFTS